MSPGEAPPRATGYEPSSQTAVVNFLVNFAWVIFLAAVVVVAVSTVAGIIRGDPSVIRGGDTLTVHAQLPSSEATLPRSLLVGENNVVLTDDPRVSISVTNPTKKQLLLDAVTLVTTFVLAGLVLWFLRGLTRSAKEGDPFTADSVRRLRGIGYTLAFGGTIAAVVNSWARDSLFDTLPSATTGHLTRSAFSIPFESIVPGMGAFVLAAVFAYGVRLREDVEATV